MKSTFRKRFVKTIIWLLLIFVVLFIFRLAYGYTKTFDNVASQSNIFDNISSTQRNYATKKYKASGNSTNTAAINVDQKYEKIAAIKTKSSEFENEEKSSRTKIEEQQALIQFEQKGGNPGNRKLHLVIGVPPENFDALYADLIQIGTVQAKLITKKDKTNEYKELNAKKKSLEQVRNSLIELKSKGGKIEEYMGLENRILEIEQELQSLGVSLGDFDDENEFCTVQFSLIEGQIVKIGIMQRVKVALEWTIKTYLRILAMLFFLTLFAYFGLLMIEKLKILERILNRRD